MCTIILNELKADLNIDLQALHVNHMIRFDDADKDEQFCKELCEGMNISITVIREDIQALAEKNKMGLEETARNFR